MRAVFLNRILLIAIVSVGASVARTVLGGQDLNFDLVTYHYYLGYSAFVDRLQQDFLPASFQGYQSPVPYALLYLLDSMGTPPIVNASLHASIHALNLILLYVLAELLVGMNGTVRNRITVIAFWLFGAIAPIYWYLVGTSFPDLTTSVPVLAGVWLVARIMPGNDRLPPSGFRWIAVGAALVGAATGIRIHNAIYVVGLLCAVALVRFRYPAERFRAIGTFSLAALAGWLLCFVPWGQRVYREFGNPLFPFYNGVFRAPDFPASNLALTSFVPDTVWDLITLPFWMATYTLWVYAEAILPDVRPGLLAASLAAYGLLWLFRRARSGGFSFTADAESVGSDKLRTAQGRRVVAVFFATSALLWLATSSNARYGVALFLLGGPVCGALLRRLLPFRYVLLVIGAVLLWQALVEEALFRQHRVLAMPWTSRYFDWNLPARLVSEPATFLSFGGQTASTLAPRVHPGSAHINLVGQYTPTIDGPGSDRIRRIMSAPHRRIYGVFDYLYSQQRVPGATSMKAYFRNHLRLWGLDFTDELCELVSVRPTADDWTWLNRVAGIEARIRPPMLIICELRPSAPANHARAMEEYRNFVTKVERLGVACPDYYGKPLTYTRVYRGWNVSSLASLETRLDFHDEGAVELQQLRPPYVAVELGRVTHEGISLAEPDCRKWFSRLKEITNRKR